MTKEKKIIIGIISILTIAIVILSYFLINKNAIIQKQAEKIELQAMETNGSNSYVTTQEHLNETSSAYNEGYNNGYNIGKSNLDSKVSNVFTSISEIKNYDYVVVYLSKDSNYGSISKLNISNLVGCEAYVVYQEVNHPTGDYYRARSCYIVKITNKDTATFSASAIRAMRGIILN